METVYYFISGLIRCSFCLDPDFHYNLFVLVISMHMKYNRLKSSYNAL